MIEGLGLVILAAGLSARMGGTDKVWAQLGPQSVVWHSLNALSPVSEHIVVVVHEQQRDRAERELSGFDRVTAIVAGGVRRQDSVARGLEVLPPATVVAVHDAARPFAQASLLVRGTELLQEYDGAVPGLPVTDTIKQVTDLGEVVKTLSRGTLRSMQTPQVFRRQCLQTAYSAVSPTSESVTDDAALLESYNYRVHVFAGQVGNFKITTEYDLRVARLLMAGSSDR